MNWIVCVCVCVCVPSMVEMVSCELVFDLCGFDARRLFHNCPHTHT